MKNIFKHKLILAAAVLGLFASCNDDEDVTEDTRAVKPVVTLTQTNFSVTEGESIEITMTADKPLNTAMDFKIELVGGEGTTFREFTVDGGDETSADVGAGIIGHIVSIPAYTTTYTFTITPDFDFTAEGTETFEFAFTSAVNARALVAPGSELITVTVANAVSDDLVVRLDWALPSTNWFGTLSDAVYMGADGDEHAFCDFDFDLEVYDSSFSAVLFDSYYDCPEQLTIPANAPDGEYIVVPSFFTRAGAVPADPEMPYAVSVTIAKPGVFSETIDMGDAFTYDQGGVVENNPDAYVPVAIVTKVGTTYTVTDFTSGEVLAQGRMAAFQNMLRNKRARN